MKARRPIRPAPPGFTLSLPKDSSHAEVQVQQKNEQDFNKFFIDADDTMVSPMITTNPMNVAGRPSTFTWGLGSIPGVNGGTAATPAPAGVPTAPKRTEPLSGSYAAALTTASVPACGAAPSPSAAAARPSKPVASTAAPATSPSPPPHPPSQRTLTLTQSQTQAASGGSSGSPEFIHVHNTNIFVLMDGVSMFFEGKSTFTGSQDPLLIQEIQKRKREKQRDRELRERKRQEASGGCATLTAAPEDSVERAIRDIEGHVGHGLSPTQRPAGVVRGASLLHEPSPMHLDSSLSKPETPLSAMPPALARGSRASGSEAACPGTTAAAAAPTSAGRRQLPMVPSEVAALFAHATRPVGSPLFGRTRASAPPPPPPPPPAAAVVSAESRLSLPAIAPGACTSAVPAPAAAASPTATLVNSSFASQSSSARVMPGAEVVASSVSLCTLESAYGPAEGYGSATPVVGGRRAARTRAAPAPRSTAAAAPGYVSTAPRRASGTAKVRPTSLEDIGHSNGRLDLDEVDVLGLIGAGSQGKVYRVCIDNKHYALKSIDVREATESTNAVERQGRKRGLVKELNMIRLQRDRPPPVHLMKMFNAVATLRNDRQQLNLLIELMSFGVEDCQKMVARMPQNEMMSLTQSIFRNYMSGNPSAQEKVEGMLKDQHGSCMHVLGRSSHLIPENWELNVERQTPMPEIVLSLLAADVLKGLRELHEDYGMVHCDLKPANVLLCYDRQSFKLADFGCSSVMDPLTKRVRRSGVDLGAKLYKAPERLSGELASNVAEMLMSDEPGGFPGSSTGDHHDADEVGGNDIVEFSGKSDVWSLGIMLLELACGVHPCSPFKSDFWNYTNYLKLSKMVKPLQWSAAFCDFIVRCLSVEESQRWPVAKLLTHPFILKYHSVPRLKLRAFMDRLEKDSATFHRRQQRKLVREQIQLSTAQIDRDNYKRQSRKQWEAFNRGLELPPDYRDPVKFPPLE